MFKVYFNAEQIDAEITDSQIGITVPCDCDNGFLEIVWEFEADDSEYVLFPACAYNGNRFDCLPKPYPPKFELNEARIDMPVTITDVPRLNKDGSGVIEVTTGDVSVPMVGVCAKKQSCLLYTIQQINGRNLGLSYQRGRIGITYPHMRKDRMYRANRMVNSTDTGIAFEKGQVVTIPYRLLQWECKSLPAFYRTFFEHRKVMGLDSTRPQVAPFSEQAAVQIKKFNQMNYRESLGCYGVGTSQNRYQVWQPGWTGGAMSSYALMKLGGEQEWERGMNTLRFLFSTQTPAGFFYGVVDEEGKAYSDAFGIEGGERWHLIRKSADVLYFLFKHFALMEERSIEIPPEFIAGAQKLADAFVTLWDRYGQFGQFVDWDTGEIVVGGSTSAAIAPAGLVSAFRFFGDERYLHVAQNGADLYYKRDAINGYTTGGPGEILQGPDSESAFGLLESFVELYDITREDKWLHAAEFMAHQCASWVVPYNYRFPETSEFGRLDMKTVGSVFANVQNKHSAPGICTLSGNSLIRLYQFTNDPLYLELLEDIAQTIGQYMSTGQRPVFSWSDPPVAMPEGFINERVNMSDWEGFDKVGGVFGGSCWSETANLLTIAECGEFLKNKE